MDIQAAIKQLILRQDFSHDQMTDVMNQIMTGNATPAQIGGFLIGLQMKGETVTEIAAAAEVMRSLATPVHIKGKHVVDTCGTGGDGASTFNVSTASAFVAAAAGCQVAKHGNRSISSSSGSADVLEAAGVNLELSPEQVKHCIETVGVGFMFAQKHHGAMKHAIGPRREMGVRTIFNLLGPLTNPAQAAHQVLGVFDKKWVKPMAEVLQKLGSQHVLVVHAEDGLDEISIGAKTHVAELKEGKVTTYTIKPEDFGLQQNTIETLTVSNAQDSLSLIKEVFDGKPGPARDIVVLNAGAAIYAADITVSLAEGIAMAAELIDSGAATQKLNALIVTSRT
ncbi:MULTISPECIES: anthranilate phosphoribosyltransferase [unclassified Methylophaga]|jgi:anthranilate phosphoribosyltransferase|uniref:anthranilate phosphoribosyltransferase n=1 Tax=unclassified Methylophaga TaxID=2629249 RepID=UPI00259D1E95|nr:MULTISPECIES: anthranilate phosphoribosyltransferase [unclassified Methylophaga]|tara:strand:+ start:4404 stop:5417 length:1014 start_codon:yes stop_codon:yes gene_type:complete